MSWVAVAVGAGTAVGGAAGGKKASKGNKAANLQADIANRLFTETDPLRQQLIGRSANFLGAPTMRSVGSTVSPQAVQVAQANGKVGGAVSPAVAQLSGGGGGMTPARNFGDVTATPTYAAYRDVANRNFTRARDNAIARLPSGGGLSDALVNLERDRASNLTQGAGQIYDSELARAMTLATGQTGTAMSGLGSAANAQALNAQAVAQQSAAKSGSLGTGLGAYVGSKNTGTGAKPATTKA